MRLRHIKGCEDFITDAKECIREDKAIELKGSIQDIFEEKRPLQIEIGMGKGQFIRNMALNGVKLMLKWKLTGRCSRSGSTLKPCNINVDAVTRN